MKTIEADLENVETGLAVIAQESGIEQTKAQVVLEQFRTFAELAADWERKARALVITDASQKEEMQLAKTARLNLKNIRTSAEKTKKKLKEGIIIEGRLIDAMYNFIVGITKPIEAELEEKEKFVERQEAARVAALKAERLEQLAPYEVDCRFFNLEIMDEGAFAQLLETSKIAHAARIEAQRKAEADRIAAEAADAEERARVAAENMRLKAKAEKREKEIAKEIKKAKAARKALEAQARADREEQERQLAAERAKAEAERKARDEAEAKRKAEERAAREKIEAQARADRERVEAAARAAKEKADAEIKEAREKAEKAIQEIAERRAREEKARLDAEAEREKLAAAGDAERVKDYVEKIKLVPVPDVVDKKCRGVLLGIFAAIDEAGSL